MRIILAILITALVVGTACNDAEKPEAERPLAADQLNAIIQRIEALETAATAPSPEPIQTATRTPPPTPVATATTPPIMAPTATAPPTPAPTATLSPTPIPVGRQDICYRALPVQEALINKFSNTYLCAAIQVAELFRITDLYIDSEGYLLKRADFVGMPNLKELSVETDLEGLAPDLFHDLSGLERFQLSIDVFDTSQKTLPADLLSGLPPSLIDLDLIIRTSSDWNENQALELPADMFASVPNIRHLYIYLYKNGRGPHLQFDPQTLSGLSRLESLRLNGPLTAFPRELFADLESLEMLRLGNRAVGGEPHILYFLTLEMLLKFGEYCNNTDYCVTGGTIEQ